MSKAVDPSALEWVGDVLEFIFSWLVMLAIAVIVTGKLLSKPINFGADSKQLLKIPLGIFNVEANGGEVILGFASLMFMLLIVALLGGADAYLLVKTNFGIDPGHFHALCFISSLISVMFATVIFLVHYIFTLAPKNTFVDDPVRYNKIIDKIAKKGNGNEQ